LAVIILGRDVALAISAIYFRWISLPPPKTFNRYWDFSLPSAEVRPTGISKACSPWLPNDVALLIDANQINTALQLALIGACTAQPLVVGAGWDIMAGMTAMQYV
jgi:cardiolipin synthase